MEYQIKLPRYHQKQNDFATSPAKRKVICAGRRGGKTTGVSRLAVEAMLAGHRVLEAAPTADQTNTFWTACKKFLAEPIAAGIIRKNETERVLEMPNGVGRIRTKTAWDADSLRGDYADFLILDEFSLMSPDAWEEVGAPMLLDNNGDAIFIFTPKRRNHAFQIYQKARSDDSGRWATWNFTSFDNPYLSKEALNEVLGDMTEDAYRQEIMAEFLDNAGAVFRNLVACMGAPRNAKPDDHKGHRIVAGLDWGKANDFTFTSLVCADCRVEVAQDRFNQIDYHFQRERLKPLWQSWGVSYILAESNSIGEPNLEELRRDGLPVYGFQTTAQTKPPLIESLALSFERVEAQWLNNPICTGELEAYEIKVSPVTNRPSYNAPVGMHDDTVIGRALAWKAITSRPVVQLTVNPFYS